MSTILVLYPNRTDKKKLQLQSELQLYIYDCMANGTKDTRGILVHKELLSRSKSKRVSLLTGKGGIR